MLGYSMNITGARITANIATAINSIKNFRPKMTSRPINAIIKIHSPNVVNFIISNILNFERVSNG